MENLQQLKVFKEVIAHKSFTRAAASLKTSKSSVTKSIVQLEEAVGIRLLNRSTRHVTPTDAGQTLAFRLDPIFQLLKDVSAELSSFASRPRGRVRVSAPHGLSLNVLGKSFEDFVSRYSDVHVSLHLSNRDEDLIGGGVDVALRIGPIEERDLIVRRLQPVKIVLCAAPAYWARRGMPSRPEDLEMHEVLTFSLWDSLPRISFVVDGEVRHVSVKSRVDADDAVPLTALALRGLGALCIPELLVRTYLGSGALVPVLQDLMPQSIWLYAAYSHRNQKSAALRAFLEFITSSSGPS